MGERYHGFAADIIDTAKTHLTLMSAATVRPRLYELVVGSADTPADQYAKWTVKRYTTSHGTEKAGFAPVNLDPNGIATALADYGAGKFTAEPTYTASSELLVFGLNQRATFRWVAAPGCELMAPATANTGLGLVPVTTGGAAIHTATMYHVE